MIIASTYRLPLRRDDSYDSAYTLPKRLRSAGVKFAIGGEGAGSPGGAANARNLPYHAAVAVAYGLPHAEGLRAVTLSAAEILGVADRVGSITVGKDASLILADGDILETETNVIDRLSPAIRDRHLRLYTRPESGGLIVGIYGEETVEYDMAKLPVDFDMSAMKARLDDIHVATLVHAAQQRFAWINERTPMTIDPVSVPRT